MALSASTLSGLIKDEIASIAGLNITDTAQLETFCLAIATAIVDHITTSGRATILANSIATSGGPAAQVGPAVPVELMIT